MSRSLIVALFLLAGSVTAADDFTPATVLDVRPVKGTKNSVTCPQSGPAVVTCSPIQMTDNYIAITVQFAGKKYTARPMPIDGGSSYLVNHPEEVAVGSTIDARDAGHGIIQLRLGAAGTIVKLEVMRVETVARG